MGNSLNSLSARCLLLPTELRGGRLLCCLQCGRTVFRLIQTTLPAVGITG